MKCPKCNYTSFDYLETCSRCGVDLRDARSLLQIIAVSPEDQAPAAPVMEMVEEEPLDEVASPEEETLDEVGDGEEILDGLDFDGSFDEMVEPTSYADQAAAEPKQADSAPGADEDELLDLDFGDLFEEKDS